MQALLNTAVDAARKAGNIIVRSLNRLHTLEITVKDHNELVTEVDQAAEQAIIDFIRARYPDHGFLGEETGRHGNEEYVWIIDPLDGTTNFIHGFPVFAVSVALEVRGQLQVGVIYDPLRQEIFTAIKGSGAVLEGRRIRVSKVKKLENALVGTGFPYRRNVQWMDEYLEMLRLVMTNTSGARRPGAAALDLAYVAAGRLDGFWEFGLKPWDIAAGILLIREAGGLVGDLTGGHTHRETGHILAGNPKIFDALLRLIAPHVPEDLKG